MADSVAQGDVITKEAIHLNTGGGVSEEEAKEGDPSVGDMHTSEGTEEERVLDAVKSFLSICEQKDARHTNAVSIVDKVLGKAGV